MDPILLSLYNRELQYIREAGAEFAKEFPKIAGRLGIEDLECADPYVERLLEGFAFLSARVQLKLEAEFPRFTQHLLETVYPQYLAPVPSMAVMKFQPDLSSGTLVNGFTVPRGSALRATVGRGEQTACEYRTSQPTTLWPIELVEAEYLGRESSHMSLPPRLRKAKASLRLRFRVEGGRQFNELPLDSLPLFLCGGPRALRLIEQIYTNLCGIAAKSGSKDIAELPGASVERMGYSDDEALLPLSPPTFQGYRLLQEYFAFHTRFLFVNLRGLQRAVRATADGDLEIVLLFHRSDPQLETVVDANDFSLYCAPAINLFPYAADRIHLSRQEYEYHVVPDRTRPMDLEVYQVREITGYGTQGEVPQSFRPLYSLSDLPSREGGDERAYFSVRRQQRIASERQRLQGPRSSYIGSEVFVSMVDSRHAPYARSLAELDVDTLCTNRDLPLLMPLGLGRTDFTLDLGAPVMSIRCVSGPSQPRPPITQSAGSPSWRLVNHLSLNYLSLVNSDQRQGAVALRDLLRLYADPLSPEMNKQIDGLRSIESRSIVRRLPGAGPIAFGRGTEVAVTLDETAYEGYGVYLIGAVLSEFFGRYASINSFTETVLKTADRGEVTRWPTQIGRRPVL